MSKAKRKSITTRRRSASRRAARLRQFSGPTLPDGITRETATIWLVDRIADQCRIANTMRLCAHPRPENSGAELALLQYALEWHNAALHEIHEVLKELHRVGGVHA